MSKCNNCFKDIKKIYLYENAIYCKKCYTTLSNKSDNGIPKLKEKLLKTKFFNNFLINFYTHEVYIRNIKIVYEDKKYKIINAYESIYETSDIKSLIYKLKGIIK